MYADVDARGGILEPPGIVEVKYRAHQQAGGVGTQSGLLGHLLILLASWDLVFLHFLF
jgi:hypothetical protein